MKKNKCPATGKIIYDTQSIANEAIINIKSHNTLNFKNKRSTGKSNQKRSYFCKYCRGYHLTSIEIFKLVFKKSKQKNEKAKKFFNSINIETWKMDSVPFDSGHFPAPN